MNSFSIILPVFNGGEYLKTCVKSLVAQTFSNYNIVVLDNCSTDGTREWLLSLRDPKISVITSEKKLSITENWGRIKNVEKKEFMTMIGHDDVLLPEYLSTMNAMINEHPAASLYQAHFDFIDSKGNVIKRCQPMPEKMEAADFLKAQLNRTMDSMGTGYMMRSVDYDRLGGIPTNYPNLIFADYALWMMLTEQSYLAISKQRAFQYRLHDSVSKVTNGEDYQRAFFRYLDFLKERMQQNDSIKKAFQTNGHGYLMYFCESLSHRILKTPAERREVTVKSFIDKCIAYSSEMLPGQDFEPLKKRRISHALWFDSSSFRRSAFKIIKQMTLLFDR